MDYYFLYSMLYNFFILVGALGLGTTGAVVFVSMIYNFDILEDELNQEDKEVSLYTQICLYEQKYFDDFRKLEDRVLSDEDLKNISNKFVEDETPSGKVIMLYNKDAESFWYYCDNKTLTYRTLDTIARLFAIKYNCKNICIDYEKEWDKGKKAALVQKENDENLGNQNNHEDNNEQGKDNEESEKSVFAKFKSYNIIKNRSEYKAKTNFDENENENKRYYIYTEKANRFSYKGKLNEYKSSKISKPKPKLNFSEFKKLNERNKKSL